MWKRTQGRHASITVQKYYIKCGALQIVIYDLNKFNTSNMHIILFFEEIYYFKQQCRETPN